MQFILTNVNGLSMDDHDTRFTALAVEDGRIKAVGSDEDMTAYREAGWPERDLEGRTVLPGFIDTHQHLGLTGQVLNGLDFSRASDLPEVLDMVADAAPHGGADDWLLGYSLNPLHLAEERFPSKEELDAVTGARPAMLVHVSWHLCVLNSLALNLLELPGDLDGMDRGEHGPTGVIRDPGSLTHVFPTVNSLMPEPVKVESFRKACEAALAKGLTTLHCLEGGEFGPTDTDILLRNQDLMPLHTVIWNQVMDVPGTLKMGLSRIGGCICADGAFSTHTAALLEPYTDEPTSCGELCFSQEQVDDFVMEANRAGLQVAMHCEGDGAIEQVLSAMEKALAACPRKDHRHRIEHCEIPTEDQIERMRKAQIIGSFQPAFFPCLLEMEDYHRLFGEERTNRMHPYRTMHEKGVRICGGSDCPITMYNPLLGIQVAVRHPISGQSLTALDAIRMFTLDAAYSAFEEKERGSIEPGKYADLVILAEDPTQVPPSHISEIEICATYVKGSEAWTNPAVL